MAAGDDAVYEVVIKNRGTKAAEGIELVLFFSEGLEATAVQGGPHEVGQGQVVCKPINRLAAGAEAIYRLTMKAIVAASSSSEPRLRADRRNRKSPAKRPPSSTRILATRHVQPKTPPRVRPAKRAASNRNLSVWHAHATRAYLWIATLIRPWHSASSSN